MISYTNYLNFRTLCSIDEDSESADRKISRGCEI